MNKYQIKINISSMDTFRFEYKFFKEKKKPEIVKDLQVCVIPMIEFSLEPISKPHISAPSTTTK